KRLKDHKEPFSTDDLASIQADVRSALGAALAPTLLGALARAEQERTKPGSHPALSGVVKDPAYKPAQVTLVHDLLTAWGKAADYLAAAGMDLDKNQPLPASGASAAEVAASQATMIFNAW